MILVHIVDEKPTTKDEESNCESLERKIYRKKVGQKEWKK